MHYLELGGAEMALIGLLQALDPARVDVDLFLYDHRGPLMKYIPEWVNVLPPIKVYSMIERPMTEALRNGCFGLVLRRMLAKYRHRTFRKKRPALYDDYSIMQYVGSEVTKVVPRIGNVNPYDLAISFLAPHNIVRDKVAARKKLAWIHTDYSKVSINKAQELPVWNGFDYIASISADVGSAFKNLFPILANKVIDIENILNRTFVRQRASELGELVEFNSDILNILSIGRYTKQKNFDNLPDICRRMLDLGAPSDLRWYIIGYGGDEALIRSKIAEAGMEEHVVLLGKKENPYPYIKACDIYVQPSRYEGKSVTVREAQMLCKPVAVTAYPTAPSQIKDGVDGVIVPIDNESCAKGLAKFISDTALQQRLADYLSSHDYGNENEVEKIYQLIDA